MPTVAQPYSDILTRIDVNLSGGIARGGIGISSCTNFCNYSMLQQQYYAYINEITGHGFRAMARTILDEVLEV
jgi:hypothetical protein